VFLKVTGALSDNLLNIKYHFSYILINTVSILTIFVLLWKGLQRDRKICGNKMPTRCNRGFYCRSCCLLNMFRGIVVPRNMLSKQQDLQ